MKPVTLPGIEEYAERNTSPDPEAMISVADETRICFQDPQMMVGPLEGRFLQMLVYAIQPRRVLEIGTFTGYSALSMAAVLPPDGQIITCEVNERHAAAARRNVAASSYADRVRIVVGPALRTLPSLTGPFDLVFIDADKVNYLAYFEAVLPKLGDHGLMVADNTLWNGDVLDEATCDRDGQAIWQFNAVVAADPRVACALLTVRDGITLIRPLAPQP